MKFSKEHTGLIVAGASVYDPTEQTFAILDFAVANGYEMDTEALETAKKSYKEEYDELGYDWFEELDWALEDALAYLNTKCCEQGVAFAFVDTDFVLLDSNYDSMVG